MCLRFAVFVTFCCVGLFLYSAIDGTDESERRDGNEGEHQTQPVGALVSFGGVPFVIQDVRVADETIYLDDGNVHNDVGHFVVTWNIHEDKIRSRLTSFSAERNGHIDFKLLSQDGTVLVRYFYGYGPEISYTSTSVSRETYADQWRMLYMPALCSTNHGIECIRDEDIISGAYYRLEASGWFCDRSEYTNHCPEAEKRFTEPAYSNWFLIHKSSAGGDILTD